MSEVCYNNKRIRHWLPNVTGWERTAWVGTLLTKIWLLSNTLQTNGLSHTEQSRTETSIIWSPATIHDASMVYTIHRHASALRSINVILKYSYAVVGRVEWHSAYSTQMLASETFQGAGLICKWQTDKVDRKTQKPKIVALIYASLL